MKKSISRYLVFIVLVGVIANQSLAIGANAANPSVPAIIEGGDCMAAEAVAPITGTKIKVTCVEKDGRFFWSTNPAFYKKFQKALPMSPCDAECEADRQGNAAAELEALDPQKYFPKWVADAQTYFSNLVLSKVKQAYGKGDYQYHFPMPQPSASTQADTSTNNFGAYKFTMMKWAENEIANLSKSNFEWTENKIASQGKSNIESEKEKDSNKVSINSKVKLEVTKNSEGKYLVEIFSGGGDKSLLLNGTKKSSKNIYFNLVTDESGYASILTDQKLSGYKLVLGNGSKVTASITVK
jgi:hypothetical protein